MKFLFNYLLAASALAGGISQQTIKAGNLYEMPEGKPLSVFKNTQDSGKITFVAKTDPKYNGTKLVLYNHITKDHDSTIVENGRFTISVAYHGASCYYFYSEYEVKQKGGYSPFGVLVTKPGTIEMEADMETFTRTKVIESKEQVIYEAFNARSDEYSKGVYDRLYKKYDTAFIRKPDEKDPRYPALMEEYKQIREEYTKAAFNRLQEMATNNPASYASMYALFIYRTNIGAEKSELLYEALRPLYKNTYESKQIVQYIEISKATAIGKIAPDFTQADTSGNAVTLSSFRGKYVLIDFWASWCGPCRAENPNLVKAFNKYKDKGFSVVGVSLDRPGKKDAWLEAIHKDGLAWTHVSDLKFWNNEVAKQYGVTSVPQNYLLDPTGKIIAINLKGEELENKLKSIY